MNWFSKSKPDIPVLAAASTTPPKEDLATIIHDQQKIISRLETRLLLLENSLESRLSEKTLHEKVLEETVMTSLKSLSERVTEKSEEIENKLDSIETTLEDLEEESAKHEKDTSESIETLADRSLALEVNYHHQLGNLSRDPYPLLRRSLRLLPTQVCRWRNANETSIQLRYACWLSLIDLIKSMKTFRTRTRHLRASTISLIPSALRFMT